MNGETDPGKPGTDELYAFADERPVAPVVAPLSANVALAPWRILVVDDEPDVHEATRFALGDLVFEGRGVSFDHAYSASEARQLLALHGRQYAVMLLDVVMEAADAGLQLARSVREEFGLMALRIVLRTGQPGYAPELETILAFDINDYKSKSELTRTRLHTSVFVALRSYSQIRQLEATRHGLEKIVAASTELSRMHGMQRFAEGVVTQICALLEIPAEGLVCVHLQHDGDNAEIIAAAGAYASLIHRPLSALPDLAVRTALQQCIQQRSHNLSNGSTCLYFPLPQNKAAVLCVLSPRAILPLDVELLTVFSSNIAVGFGNVALDEHLASLALTDQLLQIPNRAHFIQLLDQRLPLQESQMLGLIDIDDFSNINATLDQQFGDRVLQAVCTRLQQHLGPRVVLARTSSDCFGLLGPQDSVNPECAQAIFAEPFSIAGESLRLSVTSGFVHLENVDASGTELLKDASIALKQAKLWSRGKAQVFSIELRTAARDRIRMLNNLRQAFSAERLFLVFQPQIELESGRVTCVEALLRWRDEDGNFVPPDRFIPLAEQSGLIVHIGEWVARTACATLRQLITQGHPEMRMAINVSYAQFREPGFMDMLASVVQESGIPPQRLEVELTESVAVEDIALITDKLHAIKAAGMSIALDDFGTGYSSLSILHQLPADVIKIDRSFVQALSDDKAGDNIVSLIMGLARHLDMDTIAEGVETAAQLNILRALGCTHVQGYYYAKPMVVADLMNWLAER